MSILEDIQLAMAKIEQARYEAPVWVFSTEELADQFRALCAGHWLLIDEDKIQVSDRLPPEYAAVVMRPDLID